MDAPEPVLPETIVAEHVVVRLGRRTHEITYHPGDTILQTARRGGLRPPSSCEAGDCATCLARLVDGTASMLANQALDPDEVADGWVLTCQALPTSPTVSVDYDV